jgi:transcriptional regulator with XRE-family HTH domain
MTPVAADAACVLGQQIRLARHAKNWTAAELAARAAVSRATVSAIEQGSPNPSIGNVLNVAAMAGVPLFGAEDRAQLAMLRRIGQEKIALLPTRVDHPHERDDDGAFDF